MGCTNFGTISFSLLDPDPGITWLGWMHLIEWSMLAEFHHSMSKHRFRAAFIAADFNSGAADR